MKGCRGGSRDESEAEVDDPREETGQPGGKNRGKKISVGKVMVVRAIWRVCSAERVARRTPAFGFQMASGPSSEWNTMLYAAELNV